MEYKTHNEATVPCIGTSYRGEINTDYDTLVELFGEPLLGDGYKVQAEWDIIFEDGLVATVYDWKDDLLPLGVTCWHIGGKDFEAVARVDELIKKMNRLAVLKRDRYGRG